MDKRRPSILEANYLYLLVGILLITVGGFFQSKDIYSGIFITEYIIILLPMIVFMILKKYSFKEVFRLNKITFKEVILTILIVTFAYPIGMFLNSIMIVIISMFGELRNSPLPTPENASMFLKSMFLFALAPGICEEVMFRGVIQSAYERIGEDKAILITGLLFGIFHFNIQNFIAPTGLGILFGYMVYKTNSLYTGILAHTVNNGIALILSFVIGGQEVQPNMSGMEQTEVLLMGLISLAIVAIFSSVIVYFLFKLLVKFSRERRNQEYDFIYVLEENVALSHMIPIVPITILFVFSVFKYFNM